MGQRHTCNLTLPEGVDCFRVTYQPEVSYSELLDPWIDRPLIGIFTSEDWEEGLALGDVTIAIRKWEADHNLADSYLGTHETYLALDETVTDGEWIVQIDLDSIRVNGVRQPFGVIVFEAKTVF